MIARSSLSWKNFNVAHYSESIKGINTKRGIPPYHFNVNLRDQVHNSESCILRVMSL